jgi:hypothetical protein
MAVKTGAQIARLLDGRLVECAEQATKGRRAMHRLLIGAAMAIALTNHAASQVGVGELPVAPCTFLAPSTLDSKPVEARWDYICPRDRICSFQFSGLAGPSGALEVSIFILKAGLQNRAFAASVRTKEGTTYYYTENPAEFSWTVQNMTLQCKPQL